MAGYWLKLYTEILDDPKYYHLSDLAKLGMIELMMVAKKYDHNGELPPIEDVCFYTRRSEEWWKPVYEELHKIKYLVTEDEKTFIRKFAERQEKVEPAERQRKSRQRKQKQEYEEETCHEPVTNVSQNVTEIRDRLRDREDIDIDTEEELIKQPANKNKVFTSKFVDLIGMPFQNVEQGQELLELRQVYGDELVMEIAKWCSEKELNSMGHVLNTIKKKAVTWNDNKKPKEKTIAERLAEV